jgi:CRISPR-associated protein Csm5
LKNSTSLERLKEQIKDIESRCYLPGSSLKGALRTALMTFAIRAGLFRPDPALLVGNDRSKELPAENWEKSVFGKDPNYSVLRALQVSDSQPLPRQPSCLELCAVAVSAGDQSDVPIAIEAVRPKTSFQSTLTVDELALRYASELAWQDNALMLAELIPIVQCVARQRIQAALAWSTSHNVPHVAAFYANLLKTAQKYESAGAFLLQMGWGTGWEGMTVGPVLPAGMVDEIRQRYKLGKPPRSQKGWQPDLSKPFPKTHRYVTSNKVLTLPLGWVFIIMQPVGEAKLKEEWKRFQERARQRFEKVYHMSETLPISVAPERVITPLPITPLPITPLPTTPLPTASLPPVPTKTTAPATRLIHSKLQPFDRLPKPGDMFRGQVFEVRKDGTAYLELPGLDADTQAYARR